MEWRHLIPEIPHILTTTPQGKSDRFEYFLSGFFSGGFY